MESLLLATNSTAMSVTLNPGFKTPPISNLPNHLPSVRLASARPNGIFGVEVWSSNRFGRVSLSSGLATSDPRLHCIGSIALSVESGGGDSVGGNGGNGGGDGGGGGGGGGDGDGAGESGEAKANAAAAAAATEDVSALSSDVIILEVGGMTCGGCASKVKRILEGQPHVSSVNVDHTTDTAIVWPVPEAKVEPNWQKQLGESLANHLTSCGFVSKFRVLDTLKEE